MPRILCQGAHMIIKQRGTKESTPELLSDREQEPRLGKLRMACVDGIALSVIYIVALLLVTRRPAHRCIGGHPFSSRYRFCSCSDPFPYTRVSRPSIREILSVVAVFVTFASRSGSVATYDRNASLVFHLVMDVSLEPWKNFSSVPLCLGRPTVGTKCKLGWGQ
ncbi:hypothetical protein EDB87DRAFT_1639137 [Lactarius vividus]|nr:hypothetical protein EDB87DRAFT_1639137 [Lactarius vividus]